MASSRGRFFVILSVLYLICKISINDARQHFWSQFALLLMSLETQFTVCTVTYRIIGLLHRTANANMCHYTLGIHLILIFGLERL
jgi:hypothetical protein